MWDALQSLIINNVSLSEVHNKVNFYWVFFFFFLVRKIISYVGCP